MPGSGLNFNSSNINKQIRRPKHNEYFIVQPGLGIITFLVNLGNSTSLIVLTGIYGKDGDSDEFGTEPVVTYNPAQPELTHDIRAQRLTDLARPQVEKLLVSAKRRPWKRAHWKIWFS